MRDNASDRNSLPGSDDIVREVLPNGVVVLVRENFASQSVVINGSLKVGTVFEPPEKAGLSNLVASALMRGTKSRDFDTIHETLEGIGASLGIGGGVHSSSFSGKSLGEDLPVLLDVLSDALREPAFPVDQVERLRGEILTSLRIRKQDTRAVAYETFLGLAYPPAHPYSRSTSGRIEAVSQITLDEMTAFHARYYGPQRLVVVIVGAVKAADAIAQVRSALGDWTNPDQPEWPDLVEVRPMQEVCREAVAVPGKTQSDIVLGWPGPSRYEPDYHAARLANNILGVFGMMGRLGKTVREDQGLAYYSGSRLNGGMGPGAWYVSSGVNPANVTLAVDSIRHEIERIVSEPVSEEDLADNQANFTGQLPLQLESNEGVAGSILNIETFDLGIDYLRTYPDLINSITRAQVQAAAQKYLSPTAFALAIAGPELNGH
ncbi:MAG TPA: pitrilysin family protein [Aggregatilineales bacterium]|nr:pitrilysin family protein [Aggregatilineales bacterium]